MTLIIIEDGSIVSGANSYVSLSEARDYAAARNKPFPDNEGLDPLLFLAMDYLEAQRELFKGFKVSSSQSLQFPRNEVYIDGIPQKSDEIPEILKQAQINLAMQAHAGIELLPTLSGFFVKKEKVGVIETEYSEKLQTSSKPKISAVEALLKPLFKNHNVSNFITTFRA